MSKRPQPKRRPGPGGKRRPATPARVQPRRPTALIVVLGVVIVVGIAAIAAAVASGGGSKKATAPNGQQYLEYGKVEVSGSPLPPFDSNQPAKGDGTPIPTIRGQSPTGTAVTIAPGGGPQVVIVGAPWCPHCNNELPPLARALSSGSIQARITLVVTAQQPSAPHWPPADWVFNTLKWPADKAPVMLDDKAATAAEALGTSAYPYFVFVDSQGRVGSRATGEIGLDTFRSHLAALK